MRFVVCARRKPPSTLNFVDYYRDETWDVRDRAEADRLDKCAADEVLTVVWTNREHWLFWAEEA